MTVTDPDGEDDDEGLALGSIFTVSRKVFLFMSHVNRNRAVLYCTTGMGLWLWLWQQEPPRPPSPEPTIAVYENLNIIANFEDSPNPNPSPSPSPWSTISVRLVGNHPLWGHHLYVDTHAPTALQG